MLVAAVGNGDEAPKTPWHVRELPGRAPARDRGQRARPHDGSVPAFSNRDKVFNDIAAPGVGIVSTLPRSLTAARPTCVDQGYSICGPPEFRNGGRHVVRRRRGLGGRRAADRGAADARPDQVTALLERSAVDVNAATGCRRCDLRRDQYSGWGRLDVAGGAEGAGRARSRRPTATRANDEAGDQAFALYGRSIDIKATLDYWDDNVDVYKVGCARARRCRSRLAGAGGHATRTSCSGGRGRSRSRRSRSPDRS